MSLGIPGLDNKIKKTRRLVGRPKRRWEDDIFEFLIKPGEVKERTKYDLMNNSWMTEAVN